MLEPKPNSTDSRGFGEPKSSSRSPALARASGNRLGFPWLFPFLCLPIFFVLDRPAIPTRSVNVGGKASMGGDGELVRQARAGDRTALATLVHRHVGRVRATVLALLGRHPEADDIVQETLLRGIQGLATLEDPNRVGAWLRGISRNLCRDTLRRRNRDMPQPLAAELEPGAAPESTVGPAEDLADLSNAVANLPEKLREAVLLFHMEGMSYEAIAEQLEITTAAVNQRLTRARQCLRDRLRKEADR